MATRIAVFLIEIYRKLVSPLFPPACRFHPTCSAYAQSAYNHCGFFRASYLTARRILKCHPFHPGGYDPLPVGGEHRPKGPDA